MEKLPIEPKPTLTWEGVEPGKITEITCGDTVQDLQKQRLLLQFDTDEILLGLSHSLAWLTRPGGVPLIFPSSCWQWGICWLTAVNGSLDEIHHKQCISTVYTKQTRFSDIHLVSITMYLKHRYYMFFVMSCKYMQQLARQRQMLVCLKMIKWKLLLFAVNVRRGAFEHIWHVVCFCFQ